MDNKNLALRIVDLREKRDINQTELAKMIGLDKSKMSKIENGTRKVSPDELDKIADVFNVSTDYLLGRKEESKKTADLDDDDVIFTYQGKPLSEEDKLLIKRLMNGKDYYE